LVVFSAATIANDSDTKRYLLRYIQQFTNHKLFFHTYSKLNMMLNMNDVKRNMSKIYTKYLFRNNDIK